MADVLRFTLLVRRCDEVRHEAVAIVFVMHDGRRGSMEVRTPA